jgi:hypothetical protein
VTAKAVSSGGAVTLGEIAGRLPMLDVACARCERRGAGAKLPDLRTVLASDCPRVGAASIYERCGVHYPQLSVALDAR